MKAYKHVYVFSKKDDRFDITNKENLKYAGVPEEDADQAAQLCINSIKSYYANYSQEYSGYLSLFTFTRLNSGSFCFYKLEGKETEYTASILIIRDGYLNFYPVQLYGTNVFSIDSSNNGKVPNMFLSDGFPGKLKPSEGISFDKISSYIKGRGDYNLRNMLDILFDTFENPVIIKIYDKLENILMWIAALQMAFPAETAHSLFFSIEGSNSEMAECIITTGENGFINQEEIEDKEIYTFNFILGRSSKGINEFRLTRLIEMGYIISAETLNAFHRFLSKFNYKGYGNELEKCYRLFNMINFGLGNVEDEDLMGALEFAKQYSTQTIMEELFECFQNILTKIEYDLSFEKVKLLSDFMYNTAVKSKERIYLERANDFCFRFTDKYIMKSTILDNEELSDFYDKIKKTALKHVDRIIKYSYSTVRLKQIADYLGEEAHPYQSEFYLCMIVKDLITAKYSWNKATHIEGFEEFIKSCIEGLSLERMNYKQIFSAVSQDVDYFAHLSLLIYSRLLQRGQTEDFICSFSSCISEKSPEFAEETHNVIYEIDVNTRLLFEEFVFNLKEKANKPDYFWSCFKYGQRDIPGFLKKYTGEAIKIYLPLVDKEHLSVESRKLIRFIIHKDIELDKETLRYIIKEYENTLQLIEPGEEEYELIRDVDEIKKERYINTVPDITGLISFVMWVSNPGTGHRLKLKDILEECPDFKRIDNRYFQYLSWCLPHIVEYSEVSDDHKQIIDQFCRDGTEEEFFNLYVEIIKNRCLQNKSSGYSKVLNFLLSYYYYTLPKYVYMGEEHLIENMNQKIAELLNGDYIRNINDLDKDLTYEFQKRELSVPVMWKDVYTKAREKKGIPIFNQVRKIFGKK